MCFLLIPFLYMIGVDDTMMVFPRSCFLLLILVIIVFIAAVTQTLLSHPHTEFCIQIYVQTKNLSTFMAASAGSRFICSANNDQKGVGFRQPESNNGVQYRQLLCVTPNLECTRTLSNNRHRRRRRRRRPPRLLKYMN